MGAAIRHILELRYVESIRENEGGAYHVSVSWGLDKYPVPDYKLTVNFETDPVKADKLVNIVQKEVQKLVDLGPLESDLQKAKEYFLKKRPEDMKENSWWGNLLFDYYFYGLDFLTGYEGKVKALSTMAVQAYAKKTLTQGNEVRVIMRP